MRPVVLGVLATLALALLSPVAHAHSPHVERPAADRAQVPGLRVTRLVTGLDHPWDVRPIGGGRLILTQRDRATVSIWDGSRTRLVQGFPSDSVWVSGETGLMGLEVDPSFASNRTFYTCQGGFTDGGGHDVRIIRWTLRDDLAAITGSKRLLGGLPATSGRHGGCRLLAVGKRLYVGTGDAATGSNPENKRSLGGKTLCLLAATGRPCGSNPFIRSGNRNKRFVHTYGHRNVQGLDRRRDGTLWSVEQGTYRDDEVNRLRKGGDYGYDPVPGYNESVPMTDQSLPGRQRAAVWRSGDPTLATSGGGFVHGTRWGALDGSLAVAALKAERVLFLQLSASGRLQRVRVPAALREHGRIRTVVDGPGSVAYVLTDNGNGNDAILVVRPRR
ncbi:PQQ-dependent sugar dehydrogenase [Nocardioides sp.]|uniref:PQQ-dependent sugar dehydrogenase n=1 Tax=Nocardioides sp. TaxID=35761 RepID=UPI00260A1F0F|nr:PQQ-dependent sugar dehydrogenase [Nocardioides sp.]MDI6912222.1 PQQ-dependent sugar dehydrogenase [Nocardioides sp.]